MKKIAVIVAALLGVIFFANTALAKYVDSSENSVMSGSQMVDVKIVQRTKDYGCPPDSTEEIADAVSKIEEYLENLKPGDTVHLSYKIINNGYVDVLLEGVNVTVDNQELSNYLSLKWTLTQYENDTAIASVSNSADAQSLKDASGNSNVEFKNIVLNSHKNAKNYCIMDLTITFDDTDCMIKGGSETKFSITPTFKQY